MCRCKMDRSVKAVLYEGKKRERTVTFDHPSPGLIGYARMWSNVILSVILR